MEELLQAIETNERVTENQEEAQQELTDRTVALLRELQDRGMVLRDIASLTRKPEGGHYSAQYLWLVLQGRQRATLELARSLVEGLEREEVEK